MEDDFESARDVARFSYRRNPDHEKSFVLMENRGNKGYEPVGDYTVLDSDEDNFLSEKKVMNLISLLNGHEDTINLSTDVEGTRLYYYEAPHIEEDKTKILFYRQDGQGVSKENALFLINKEIWINA